MNMMKLKINVLVVAMAVGLGLILVQPAKADLATALAISLVKKMTSSTMRNDELKYSKRCVAGERGPGSCKIRKSDLDAWKGAPAYLIDAHPLFAHNNSYSEWIIVENEQVEVRRFLKMGKISCYTLFYLHEDKVLAVYMTEPEAWGYDCFTSVEFRPRDMLRGGVLWEPGN